MNLFLQNMFYMPAMVEWSGNRCCYDCIYCFVENSSKYKANSPVEIVNQLKNPTGLAGQAIKLGYPLLFSNRTDPFAECNMPATRIIAKMTACMANGVIWQTKTGSEKDIEHVLNEYAKAGKKNAIFAITLNTLDDAKRWQIEPKAPSTKHRLKIAKMIREAGLGVMANVAPMHNGIVPEGEFSAFVGKLLEHFDTAHSCAFHISRRAYKKRELELAKAGIDTPSGDGMIEAARQAERLHPRFTLTDGTSEVLYDYYKSKLGKIGIHYGCFMERLRKIPSGQQVRKEDFIEPFAEAYPDIIDRDMRMREWVCLQDLNLYKRWDVQRIRTLRQLLSWLYANPFMVFSPYCNGLTRIENEKFYKL